MILACSAVLAMEVRFYGSRGWGAWGSGRVAEGGLAPELQPLSFVRTPLF